MTGPQIWSVCVLPVAAVSSNSETAGQPPLHTFQGPWACQALYTWLTDKQKHMKSPCVTMTMKAFKALQRDDSELTHNLRSFFQLYPDTSAPETVSCKRLSRPLSTLIFAALSIV